MRVAYNTVYITFCYNNPYFFYYLKEVERF